MARSFKKQKPEEKKQTYFKKEKKTRKNVKSKLRPDKMDYEDFKELDMNDFY